MAAFLKELRQHAANLAAAAGQDDTERPARWDAWIAHGISVTRHVAFACLYCVGKRVAKSSAYAGLSACVHSAAESTSTSGGVAIRVCGPKPKVQPTDHAPALRAVSYIHLAVADHDRLFRARAGLFHQRAKAEGIGLLYGKAVAPIDMEEVVRQAQTLADAARRIHRLVGEHGHDS